MNVSGEQAYYAETDDGGIAGVFARTLTGEDIFVAEVSQGGVEDSPSITIDGEQYRKRSQEYGQAIYAKELVDTFAGGGGNKAVELEV